MRDQQIRLTAGSSFFDGKRKMMVVRGEVTVVDRGLEGYQIKTGSGSSDLKIEEISSVNPGWSVCQEKRGNRSWR